MIPNIKNEKEKIRRLIINGLSILLIIFTYFILTVYFTTSIIYDKIKEFVSADMLMFVSISHLSIGFLILMIIYYLVKKKAEALLGKDMADLFKEFLIFLTVMIFYFFGVFFALASFLYIFFVLRFF